MTILLLRKQGAAQPLPVPLFFGGFMKNRFPAFSRQTHGPVLAALVLLVVLLVLPTGFEGNLI